MSQKKRSEKKKTKKLIRDIGKVIRKRLKRKSIRKIWRNKLSKNKSEQIKSTSAQQKENSGSLHISSLQDFSDKTFKSNNQLMMITSQRRMKPSGFFTAIPIRVLYSETLTKKQPKLYLWLNMSQTFVYKQNYDKRGTFKIYCSFVFGQAHFQWECYRHSDDSIKLLKRSFLNNSLLELDLQRAAIKADIKCRSPSATWQAGE